MDEVSFSANGRDKKPLTLKGLQKHILSGLFAAILVAIPFYFHTNYTLSGQGEQLNTITKRIDAHDTKIESIQTDLTTIKSQMTDVKESQNQTQADIQKIYDILLSMKK
jgi:peptidoglycan hydrolase CwlO-like protein